MRAAKGSPARGRRLAGGRGLRLDLRDEPSFFRVVRLQMFPDRHHLPGDEDNEIEEVAHLLLGEICRLDRDLEHRLGDPIDERRVRRRVIE